MPNISTLSILIADDSRLVTTALSIALKNYGFRNISIAFKPFDAFKLCKQNQFDIIICDYNFHNDINGFQIIDELKHYNILPAKTAFIFLTGESENKTVRSMIDAEPDDYILKPYNNSVFIERILECVERKQTLMDIYVKRHEHDHAGVVEACDNLTLNSKKYSNLVRKFRAQAYANNQQFDEARKEYESLLKEKNVDWVKTSLANVLIENDESEAARNILELVGEKETNPFYHDEMSHLAAANDDIPTAIEHLKASTMLLDAGAERDLVITNLSISSESYKDAVTYIKRYYHKNENTFRANEFTMLNYIRCYLYRASHQKSRNSFENTLIGISPMINKLKKNQAIAHHNNLIQAHISLIRQDFKEAIRLLKETTKAKPSFHFYDYYHLCFLLEECAFARELRYMLKKCRASISKKQDPSIYRSQLHMIHSFEHRANETAKKISDMIERIKKHRSSGMFDMDDYLECCFELHELMPNSKRFCIELVKVASNCNIQYKGQYNVVEKLSSCHQVITHLCSEKELDEMNFYQHWQKAQENEYLG